MSEDLQLIEKTWNDTVYQEKVHISRGDQQALFRKISKI